MNNNISELLNFYRALGVENLFSDTAICRFDAQINIAENASATAVSAAAVVAAAPVNSQNAAVMPAPKILPVTPPPSDAIKAAKALADSCTTLAELEKSVREFDGIALKKTATNTVFADGVASAKVMLIGEAPGAEEDEQGIPFCGASGQMLDQMLGLIGLSRKENFYITNTIFWRPPGNRRPTPEEMAICRPFVEKHIALINPALLILVGGTAVAALHDPRVAISKVRGTFFPYNATELETEISTTAIFHPSYLLRSPGQKRIAWHDLLTIRARLRSNAII
jgi:uracil-DNA glycosylase family 4